MAKRTTAEATRQRAAATERPGFMAAVDACEEIAGRLEVARALLEFTHGGGEESARRREWSLTIAEEVIAACLVIADDAAAEYENQGER